MTKLPTISIITPSFNQGQYIKETIDSVLAQHYPNLEYWVIDGKSKDSTVEILRSFGTRINWISEKDQGQTEAINKGLKLVTGDIVAYINSDDLYLTGTFSRVAQYFSKNKKAQWLTGDYEIIDEKGVKIQSWITAYKRFLRAKSTFARLAVANFIPQPSTFWRKDVIREIGEFDASLKYCMDYDLWLRAIQKYPLHVIDKKLSQFRIHKSAKGVTQYKQQFREELDVAKRYTSDTILLGLHKLHADTTVWGYSLIK